MKRGLQRVLPQERVHHILVERGVPMNRGLLPLDNVFSQSREISILQGSPDEEGIATR